MSQAPIPHAVVQLVIARLQAQPLPEENVAQTCYLLGWLEALDAVAHALALDGDEGERATRDMLTFLKASHGLPKGT